MRTTKTGKDVVAVVVDSKKFIVMVLFCQDRSQCPRLSAFQCCTYSTYTGRSTKSTICATKIETLLLLLLVTAVCYSSFTIS